MINKLYHKMNPKLKQELDPPPPAFEYPKPLVSEDPTEVKPVKYAQIPGTIPKFETRFLNNVCNVEQFSFYSQYGRNIEWIEPEGYKLFHFIQRRSGFMLNRLVSDWIKDKNGVIWLIGVKSFSISNLKLTTKIIKGQ